MSALECVAAAFADRTGRMVRPPCYATSMMNVKTALRHLSNSDFLDATRTLIRDAAVIEADLLAHIVEIDERNLYKDCAFPSLFTFCVVDLGFSEDAAYTRIRVRTR
jgi:hypothetical protein